MQTFLADPENDALCKPVPEPYLIAPLTIGPLDTTSIVENEEAYERYYFFREVNDAARNTRRPFYQDGGYGWLIIYYTKEWAAYLKLLGERREEPGSDLFRLSRDEELGVVKAQVWEDAGDLIPDTDLKAPVQGILKEMYAEYVVEAEVERRVEAREQLRQERRQLKDNALSLPTKGGPAEPDGSRQESRRQRQKSVCRHLDVHRRAELDEERVYANLVEQLTSLADMTAFEIEPKHTSRYSMEYGRGSLKQQRPSVHRDDSWRSSADLRKASFENASPKSPRAWMQSGRNGAEGEGEGVVKSPKKAKRVSAWLRKVVD